MRVLDISCPKELKRLMHDIGVDPYGIGIMLPKTVTRLVRLTGISNIAANILKQEMLSLGADAAVAKGSLTGSALKTDCLLIGNLSQFRRLSDKLRYQPFGLKRLSGELSSVLNDYLESDFKLKAGRFKLNLGSRPHIMGIVNITPDSFSGDGLYRPGCDNSSGVLVYAQRLIREGADIIDVGGESTRPGARRLGIREELSRVIPAVKLLAKMVNVPISVDTYKPEVARAALDCGASIINDITALRDARMAGLVRRYRAAVIIMHMKGRPSYMQKNPVYKSLMEEIPDYLRRARDKALAAGICRESIVVDPGIGFGKTREHNLEILKRLKELRALGQPILVGTSRKAFLASIMEAPAQGRVFGSIASSLAAVNNGAHIVRVHDVGAMRQSLDVLTAIEKR
ncbi:MAG: dihydropteroate synthase [Candidatus Omnitrophota bacterium]